MLESVAFDIGCIQDKKSIHLSSSDPKCRVIISVEIYSKAEFTGKEYYLAITNVESQAVVNSVRDTNLKLFLYKCGTRIQASLNQHASELVWDFLLENL
ncbi:hypothetical protein LCGC14_0995310 [marine sediment metagenome]|uniref:Uncharacterized protein n=1 Tax=marine sediment metagenome TaxID=412755 RepID=A0A0F9RAY5_9ZZZZ